MDELTRLAQQARLGDDAALEAFVQGGYGDVWRFCAALVDDRTADDLAQETFVRAIRALRGFRADASARTWLLSIARRTCADEIRLRGRRRRSSERLADEKGAGLELAPDPTRDVDVQALLRDLAPERRAAFVLTQLLGLSYAEAAQACDCPPGTIRSRVARARDDLIRLLAGGALPEVAADPSACDRPNRSS